jgi:cold shock CspA family protein
MPKGTLVWFDDQTGEGLIRRDGREYPVRSPDIEKAACVPNAPVHFDIVRHEGVRWAVNVTLRRGTRVSPRQHRFGDLAGAHHPDEKGHHPLTDDRPGVDPAYEGRPTELVEEWARLVNLEDLSTLRLLYAPEAVLHEGRKRVVGRDAIIEYLSARFSGLSPQARLLGGGDDVVAVELSVGGRSSLVELELAHGRVVAQRVRPASRRRPKSARGSGRLHQER